MVTSHSVIVSPRLFLVVLFLRLAANVDVVQSPKTSAESFRDCRELKTFFFSLVLAFYDRRS